MTKKLIKVLICISMLNSTFIWACFPAKISIEQRIKSASHISVGYVTGKILDDFEASINNPQQSIQTNESSTLRVKITQNIKGVFDKNIINPKINPCGSGNANLKEKVIVFLDGEYWFVMAFDEKIIERVTELYK